MKPYPHTYHSAAQLLRSAGHTYPRIAEILNVPLTTTVRWINPSYAERSRAWSRANKHRYRGTCIDCGTPTSWSSTRRHTPATRCANCAKQWQQTPQQRLNAQLWTPRRILLAIQEWADIYGEPPAIADWNPYMARSNGDEPRAQRFERAHGRWPTFTTVIRRFGTWNTAIKAAGYSGRCNTGGCGNAMRQRRFRA